MNGNRNLYYCIMFPLAFSKAFKKIKGVSPKEYRLKKKETTEKFLLNEIK